MSRIRVAVIRGGPSSEYDVSLRTGASVMKHLPEKYEARDVLITKDRTWHMAGIPSNPSHVFSHVDVVFNALHGTYGEDGQIQKLFDDFGVPYTGSQMFPSFLGMNKDYAKRYLTRHDIHMPRAVNFDMRRDNPAHVASSVSAFFSPPWIVKPAASGSSVGVSLAKTSHELMWSLEKALFHGPRVLVEEFIKGKEATAGVVDDFRGKRYYSLLPVEIVRQKTKKVFDYETKYSPSTIERCPGNFTAEQKKEMEDVAAKVHTLLGLRHYSRSDFIVSPRGVYWLEVNTLPGLTEQSLLPKSLSALGCSYPQFLDHLLTLALRR